MLDVQRVQDACNPAASADLAALLITDGLANLLLVGAACTVSKAKIEHSLPRKRGAAAAGYEKAMHRFFTKVVDARSDTQCKMHTMCYVSMCQ